MNIFHEPKKQWTKYMFTIYSAYFAKIGMSSVLVFNTILYTMHLNAFE